MNADVLLVGVCVAPAHASNLARRCTDAASRRVTSVLEVMLVQAQEPTEHHPDAYKEAHAEPA
eukprot:CAMPEP_0172724248 /NCGR_PEP_ID=MMETSP1074-20121228/85529_1 /TAXON_ID=2916 /ORGANISM="Ceratium fusus, Strain PA161109" /LENGTH=62 /DNA_ID=CAMNT_0013550665 /DNA_START=77 /DNA_END=265 /DNA_ORIENTATION=-